MQKENDIIISLIKEECSKNGFAYEPIIVKKATILNIHFDRYQIIKKRLVCSGKILEERHKFFISEGKTI